jgi:hypothetical protein
VQEISEKDKTLGFIISIHIYFELLTDHLDELPWTHLSMVYQANTQIRLYFIQEKIDQGGFARTDLSRDDDKTFFSMMACSR